MNNIASLKTLLIVEPKKRIGTISEVSSGYAIITDFLNRTFKATIPENLDLIVGDTVIVLGGAVIGKTKIESSPSVYEV
jgi:hypothetical protein